MILYSYSTSSGWTPNFRKPVTTSLAYSSSLSDNSRLILEPHPSLHSGESYICSVSLCAMISPMWSGISVRPKHCSQIYSSLHHFVLQLHYLANTLCSQTHEASEISAFNKWMLHEQLWLRPVFDDFFKWSVGGLCYHFHKSFVDDFEWIFLKPCLRVPRRT